MTFYLLHDGHESGPYNWVEVYLMLRKGELDYSDMVRCNEETEFQQIETLGFWNEGSDVGPLTWEEILLLRQEAGLSDDIAAKIEGEMDYSTLETLLSERPNLASPGRKDVFMGFLSDRKWAVPAVAVIGIFLLTGLMMFIRSINDIRTGEAPPVETPPVSKVETSPEPEKAAGTQQAEITQESPPSVEETPIAKEAIAREVPAPEIREAPPDQAPITLSIPKEALNKELAGQADGNNALASPVAPEAAEYISPAKPAPVAEKQASVTAIPEPATGIVNPAPVALSTPTAKPKAKPTPELSQITSNFFQIHSIKALNRPPRDNMGVWKVEKNRQGREVITDFISCLEVQVSTRDGIAAKDVFARAYFFDSSEKRVATYKEPSKAGSKNIRGGRHSMPVIFKADKKERLFFEIPADLKGKRWKAVVVFGDKQEAKAMTYPQGTSHAMLDFPEKQLVDNRSLRKVRRKRVADQVIEYVAKTRNPKHPQITLFLRPPKGIEDWSEVQGVYALVVLGNSVEDIRRRMQAVELEGDEAGSFAFANKHKLAILVWGSRRIWNPRMNYDDYDRRDARELDRDFDLVANAWEEAIKYFHKEYGTPTNNFILRGNCGAAQWAKRLCLRKPDYFLAVHIHLAGSYDKPTPEGRKSALVRHHH